MCPTNPQYASAHIERKIAAKLAEKAETTMREIPDTGMHCIRCGVEYETPSRPNCECAGDPPTDRNSLDYEAYLDRVRRLRFDR